MVEEIFGDISSFIACLTDKENEYMETCWKFEEIRTDKDIFIVSKKSSKDGGNGRTIIPITTTSPIARRISLFCNIFFNFNIFKIVTFNNDKVYFMTYC